MKKFINNYKKLCSEYYDLDKPSAPAEALKYYSKEALRANGPILEPMCGTGRFLIPLLEKGLNVQGVDASSEMLELCKEKCKSKNLYPKLYFDTLKNLDLPIKYNYIFIPSGSFGLLINKQEAKESLKKLFSHLSNQGKMDIEVERPYSTFENGIKTESYVKRNDGVKIGLTTIRNYDFATNIETIECIYEDMANNKIYKENEIIEVKHYSEDEFKDLAILVGFREVKICKMYSASDMSDDVILFRCTK
ncbi:MAG: class I SAM-dependent methyltransferase [Bacilli bacterium]